MRAKRQRDVAVMLVAAVGLVLSCSSPTGIVDGGGTAGGARGSGVGGGTGGGATAGGGTAGGPTDAGMPIPAAYQAEIAQAAQATVDVQQVIGLVDSFFQLDPTLDPSKTPEENALAIQTRTQQTLAGCGSVTVSGAMVTVQLNSSSGCPLSHQFVAAGTISMNVSAASGYVVVSTMLSGAMVNGMPMSVSLQFSTPDGTSFSIIGTVMANGISLSLSLQVSAAGGPGAGDIFMSGTVVVVSGGTGTATYNFQGILWYLDQCYPSDGELAVSGTGELLRFDLNSGFSGQFIALINNIDYVGVMPPWAMCPR